MLTKDLKKNKKYYYTAGSEWVEVQYKHETINGFMFSHDGCHNVLTMQAVNNNITEI